MLKHCSYCGGYPAHYSFTLNGKEYVVCSKRCYLKQCSLIYDKEIK